MASWQDVKSNHCLRRAFHARLQVISHCTFWVYDAKGVKGWRKGRRRLGLRGNGVVAVHGRERHAPRRRRVMSRGP